VPSPNISMEDFHKILVDQFDIKICSLAWDGNKLYYPPANVANLKQKTSMMRFKICNLPTPTDNARDLVYAYNSKLGKSFDRFDKYQYRGFKLTPFLQYW